MTTNGENVMSAISEVAMERSWFPAISEEHFGEQMRVFDRMRETEIAARKERMSIEEMRASEGVLLLAA
jgi:hypothetical protein